jgi:hypothetical protein
VYLLAFQAYINEMQGSRSKIPSKKSPRQAPSRGVFNSGVKALSKRKRQNVFLGEANIDEKKNM